MSKYISPGMYESLTIDERLYYQPEWSNYREVKERHYEWCEYDTRHFLGWETIRTPIGEPYRYVELSGFALLSRRMEADIVDNLNRGNVLTDRILSDPKGWK